jgi:hypothetical protein
MPRAARIAIPDVPVHITQRGNNRQDVFFVDNTPENKSLNPKEINWLLSPVSISYFPFPYFPPVSVRGGLFRGL